MTVAAEPAAGPITPAAIAVLLGLILIGRFLVAALVPLAPDEAYYALWAQHLSAGYLDHPPMIAFFIRPGMLLFGETPLGVRLVCVLSAIPASWLIWRAAERLVADRRAAPLAALLYNLTLLGSFGTAVATPDAPLALFAAAMVYAAARLMEDGRPLDWGLMGLATGLALQSKYSAALLAAGFAIAVLAIPAWRRKLIGPGPWLALAVALLVFAPNILWNADHDWATFLKQGGRVADNRPLTPSFLLELIGAQIGLMTPLIFALACLGLMPRFRSAYRSPSARLLLLCLIGLPVAYFLFHALRSRVEGNWPGFLYPALAIAAAAALVATGGVAPSWLAWLRRWAIPSAAGLLLVGSAYAITAPLPSLGTRDPILRMTRGWPQFAADVEELLRSTGANYILTDDYQLNAELALWLPDVPVEQWNQRERYGFQAPSPFEHLAGTGLWLTRNETVPPSIGTFGSIEPAGVVTRRYKGTHLARIQAYRVEATAPSSPGP